MDASQKIEPDECERRSEEEESCWSEGIQEHKRRSETQATTITIHLAMTPMRIDDKTQREERKREILEERREGVEGQQKDKMEMKEKECRSIGTQTTPSLDGVSEPSEGREKVNIQSLPPEIIMKILNNLPNIKTRFSLRHVCSQFRNCIDDRVCWRSRDELRVVVKEGGWWFSINGCLVSGSRKEPKIKMFHSYKRIRENVCEGIRAMFNRINIRNIIIEGADCLTDTDVLLALAGEMLKHEQRISERQLRSVELFGWGHLTQPLMFSIFIPVASGLDHLRLDFSAKQEEPSITTATEDSICRLIKCCTKLRLFFFWPVLSLRCLEAIRGRPLQRFVAGVMAYDMGPHVQSICDSIPRTLTEFYLFGRVNHTTFSLPDLMNKEQLQTIGLGSFLTVAAANGRIARLVGFRNLRHILFTFFIPVSCLDLVSMVTTIFTTFRQDTNYKQIERHISFRVRNGFHVEVDPGWPQESVREAFEEEQIEVLETSIRPNNHCYDCWAAQTSPLTWLELRRENVSVSLHCNCVSH